MQACDRAAIALVLFHSHGYHQFFIWNSRMIAARMSFPLPPLPEFRNVSVNNPLIIIHDAHRRARLRLRAGVDRLKGGI